MRSCGGFLRQVDEERRPAFVRALEPYLAAVFLHDALRRKEAETGSDRIFLLSIVGAEEFLEYAGLVACGDADAGVSHRNIHDVVLVRNSNEDFVARIAVFDRVLDEILQNDADLFFVEHEGREGFGFEENDLNAALVGFAGEIEEHALDQFYEIVFLEIVGERHVFGVVDREHFVHHFYHALVRVEGAVREVFLFRCHVTEVAVDEHFEYPFHGRERRAELVRRNRDQIAFDVVEFLELFILYLTLLDFVIVRHRYLCFQYNRQSVFP